MFDLTIFIFVLIIVGLVGWIIYSSRKSNKVKPSELLVFPDKTLPCASVYKELYSGQPISCIKRKQCTHAHFENPTSLIRMLQCLASAEKEILICMYSFTFDKLADLLIAKKKSGCTISIITHSPKSKSDETDNDQTSRLKAQNIDVRYRTGKRNDKYEPKMHNKFVVIDDDIVMHGSGNWSVGAILHNDETITISYENNLIKDFRAVFERIWSQM